MNTRARESARVFLQKGVTSTPLVGFEPRLVYSMYYGIPDNLFTEGNPMSYKSEFDPTTINFNGKLANVKGDASASAARQSSGGRMTRAKKTSRSLAKDVSRTRPGVFRV